MGYRRIDHGTFELDTAWRGVASFITNRFTPGQKPRYPSDRWLGGPQIRSKRCGEEKNHTPNGTPIRTPRPSSREPVAIPAALSLLLN